MTGRFARHDIGQSVEVQAEQVLPIGRFDRLVCRPSVATAFAVARPIELHTIVTDFVDFEGAPQFLAEVGETLEREVGCLNHGLEPPCRDRRSGTVQEISILRTKPARPVPCDVG